METPILKCTEKSYPERTPCKRWTRFLTDLRPETVEIGEKSGLGMELPAVGADYRREIQSKALQGRLA